jgi:hypothetical protein
MNENEAAEALAVIRQERLAAAERLGATGPLAVAAAVVMGVATAALAVHSTVVAAVSTVVFMIGLLFVFGTSARAGMVPRDSLRSAARVFLGAMALLALFAVGLTGQQFGLRWLSIVAGVLSLVAALGVARWWRGGLRRELLTGDK